MDDKNNTDTLDDISTLLDIAPIGIVCANMKGEITYWNAGATKIFGYHSKEMLNKPLITIIPEIYRNSHTKAFNALVDILKSHPENATVVTSKVIGHIIPLKGIRSDKSEFPCEVSVAIHSKENHITFMGFVSDVTGVITINTLKNLVDSYKHISLRAEATN